jgi:Zn finger protein HypA/HybF involved in hydrogenase expression
MPRAIFSGVSLGVCPAGGSHDPSGSINYKLTIVDGNEGDQRGWRWCKKCQGLFFSLNPTSGYCPTGGGHDYTGSVDYQHIPSGFNLQGTQRGWQWCNKCQGTFFDGNNTSGHCPTGGGHDYAGSIGYQLQIN